MLWLVAASPVLPARVGREGVGRRDHIDGLVERQVPQPDLLDAGDDGQDRNPGGERPSLQRETAHTPGR